MRFVILLSSLYSSSTTTTGRVIPSHSHRFWISGISKGVATLLTYPLIRAKAVGELDEFTLTHVFMFLCWLASEIMFYCWPFWWYDSWLIFIVWHGKISGQLSHIFLARLWSRPREVTNIYGACWCRPWDGCKSNSFGCFLSYLIHWFTGYPQRLALSGMKAGFLFTKASGALEVFFTFQVFENKIWAEVWIMSYKTVLFNSLMMVPWLTILQFGVEIFPDSVHI